MPFWWSCQTSASGPQPPISSAAFHMTGFNVLSTRFNNLMACDPPASQIAGEGCSSHPLERHPCGEGSFKLIKAYQGCRSSTNIIKYHQTSTEKHQKSPSRDVTCALCSEPMLPSFSVKKKASCKQHGIAAGVEREMMNNSEQLWTIMNNSAKMIKNVVDWISLNLLQYVFRTTGPQKPLAHPTTVRSREALPHLLGASVEYSHVLQPSE